ncbi:MAG: 50S ribosomal protein L10, partial [Pyrobaculum sp.]
TLPMLLSRAAAEANALAAVVASKAPELGLSVAAPQMSIQQQQSVKQTEEVSTEGEKKEGPSEEEIAGSLASLF